MNYTRTLAEGYMPSDYHLHPRMDFDRLMPGFDLSWARQMLVDYQVALGTSIREAPLLRPRIEIQAGDAIMQEFIEQEIADFWAFKFPRVLAGVWKFFFAAECVYKYDRYGMLHLDKFVEFDQDDVKVRHKGQEPLCLEIKYRGAGQVTRDPLRIPIEKTFLYIHNRGNSWKGNSDLYPAFQPYIKKNKPRGAIASRDLWTTKYAFSGGVLFHPPGGIPNPSNPLLQIPHSDIARQVMDNIMNGGGMTLERSSRSSESQQDWEYIPAEIQKGAAELNDIIERLDLEITRGLRIPDDVIKPEGVGGYAGRSIPFKAFITMQTLLLRLLFKEYDEQILRPLVEYNFGPDADYQVLSVEPDDDSMQPQTPEEILAAGQNPDQLDETGQPVDENAPEETPEESDSKSNKPAKLNKPKKLSVESLRRNPLVRVGCRRIGQVKFIRGGREEIRELDRPRHPWAFPVVKLSEQPPKGILSTQQIRAICSFSKNGKV